MRSLLVVILAAGCSGGSDTDTDTGAAETGGTNEPSTMVLSFDLDPDLIPTMEEPAAGVFHGSLFAEADASPIGPNDGAVALLDFDSPALDFGTAGGVQAETVTVGPIDPQVVWIVGCLDSDANECDKGDPITIPNENKQQVTPGEAAYVVRMTLLNPS